MEPWQSAMYLVLGAASLVVTIFAIVNYKKRSPHDPDAVGDIFGGVVAAVMTIAFLAVGIFRLLP